MKIPEVISTFTNRESKKQGQNFLRSLDLVKVYWHRLTMVARAGGYCWTRVTQGDPLSPTIFNVVVGAVVRHRVHGVVEKVEAQGETGWEGRHHAAIF